MDSQSEFESEINMVSEYQNLNVKTCLVVNIVSRRETGQFHNSYFLVYFD